MSYGLQIYNQHGTPVLDVADMLVRLVHQSPMVGYGGSISIPNLNPTDYFATTVASNRQVYHTLQVTFSLGHGVMTWQSKESIAASENRYLMVYYG